MRPSAALVGFVLVAALAGSGCADDDRESNPASPTATSSSTRTPTSTDTETPAPCPACNPPQPIQFLDCTAYFVLVTVQSAPLQQALPDGYRLAAQEPASLAGAGIYRCAGVALDNATLLTNVSFQIIEAVVVPPSAQDGPQEDSFLFEAFANDALLVERLVRHGFNAQVATIQETHDAAGLHWQTATSDLTYDLTILIDQPRPGGDFDQSDRLHSGYRDLLAWADRNITTLQSDDFFPVTLEAEGGLLGTAFPGGIGTGAAAWNEGQIFMSAPTTRGTQA